VASTHSNDDKVQKLREQRDQAQASGDAAKAADLEQQIREAEAQAGTAQQ
jgi:hypothetical protein